jgi:hypothetical protein
MTHACRSCGSCRHLFDICCKSLSPLSPTATAAHGDSGLLLVEVSTGQKDCGVRPVQSCAVVP